MEQHQLRERREALPIAKKLYKFIELPNATKWRVHDMDVLAHGRIASYTRTKNRFWPDDITCLKMRLATVTSHGFLILYEVSDQGIVVDLRKARAVITNSDTFKGQRLTYKRCHIKIRLDCGNVHLFVKDDSIAKWTSAIITAHSNIKRAIKQTAPNNVAPTEEPVDSAQEAIEDPNTNSLSSNSGMITVIENPTIDQISSVRQGHLTVASIRKKLEKELVMKEVGETKEEVQNGKHFVSSVFYHAGPSNVNEEKSEVVIKDSTVFVVPSIEEEQGSSKAWWLRSLRC